MIDEEDLSDDFDGGDYFNEECIVVVGEILGFLVLLKVFEDLWFS